MNRRFTRVIGSYQCQFELCSHVISLTFRSYEDYTILSAHFIDSTLPHHLVNVINNVQQLFAAIINLDRENMAILNNELILRTKVFSMDRDYPLLLNQSDLGQEQKFMRQSQQIKRELQREATDIWSTEKKGLQCCTPRSQVLGQSQSNPQSKKQKLLTQLNFTIQEENHQLLEKNQNMARQLEIFQEQQSKLKAYNKQLTQEREDIAQNNRLLQREKERLAQLFEESQQEQERKKQEEERNKQEQQRKKQEKTAKEIIKSRAKKANLRVELIKDQKDEFTEIASILEEKADAVKYKLDLAQKVKILWDEVMLLEQKYQDLTTKKDKLSMTVSRLRN